MARAPQPARVRSGLFRAAAQALAGHWPEYLMEGAELGLFMFSACAFGVLLEHPSSPVRQAIGNPFLRRALMGGAMGLTSIVIVYSPIGKRSGAHFNPSLTLTFCALGKVKPWDALFYALSQFGGGALGVIFAAFLIGTPVNHSAVNYVVTVPGPRGVGIAFFAEAGIAFVLMLAILGSSNAPRLARFTPVLAGALVAAYITLEAPLSGMSMNPARTLASALSARQWTALWIYFTAPPLGMLAASGVYTLRHGAERVFCAKLHHHNGKRCIFRCRYAEMRSLGEAKCPQMATTTS